MLLESSTAALVRSRVTHDRSNSNFASSCPSCDSQLQHTLRISCGDSTCHPRFSTCHSSQITTSAIHNPLHSIRICRQSLKKAGSPKSCPRRFPEETLSTLDNALCFRSRSSMYMAVRKMRLRSSPGSRSSGERAFCSSDGPACAVNVQRARKTRWAGDWLSERDSHNGGHARLTS